MNRRITTTPRRRLLWRVLADLAAIEARIQKRPEHERAELLPRLERLMAAVLEMLERA